MSDKPQKSGRGGYRPGAGRKKVGKNEPAESVTVTLLPRHIARLTDLGDGNLSLGIRRLVDRLDGIDDTAGQPTND